MVLCFCLYPPSHPTNINKGILFSRPACGRISLLRKWDSNTAQSKCQWCSPETKGVSDFSTHDTPDSLNEYGVGMGVGLRPLPLPSEKTIRIGCPRRQTIDSVHIYVKTKRTTHAVWKGTCIMDTKTFVDIVIDHLNDIRVSLIEIPESKPKTRLRHLALVIYGADPTNIIVKEKIMVENKDGIWTMYMEQGADVYVSLLETIARLFRNEEGEVYLELNTADYNATFKIKGIIATEDLPF